MKKRLLAGTLVLLAALSCSTTSRLQSQAFDDGIYSRPSQVAQAVAPTNEELDNLLADSHSSEAYILSAGDTLVIPAGKNIRFNFNDNSVTVWDTPSWAWNYSWSYRPWYLRDYSYYWGYYNPWYYDSWYHRPWRYSSWYHYGPWYYDSWSYWYDDPVYYSYGPYYSPWYYHSWYYHSWYYDSWYWNRRYPGWYDGYYGGHYWGGPTRLHRSQAANLGHREGNFSARRPIWATGRVTSRPAVLLLTAASPAALRLPAATCHAPSPRA